MFQLKENAKNAKTDANTAAPKTKINVLNASLLRFFSMEIALKTALKNSSNSLKNPENVLLVEMKTALLAVLRTLTNAKSVIKTSSLRMENALKIAEMDTVLLDQDALLAKSMNAKTAKEMI